VTFAVAADSYDKFMGRYSTLLAPQFADLAGVRLRPQAPQQRHRVRLVEQLRQRRQQPLLDAEQMMNPPLAA